MIVEWKDEYNLGIKEIDEQHKILIELINNLYTSFMNKTQDKEVLKVLDELFKYTDYHFKTEERYFRLYNYHNQVKHVEEHRGFVKKLNEFRLDSKEYSKTLVFPIIKFLQNWILNHIVISDADYVELFKRSGNF